MCVLGGGGGGSGGSGSWGMLPQEHSKSRSSERRFPAFWASKRVLLISGFTNKKCVFLYLNKLNEILKDSGKRPYIGGGRLPVTGSY